MDNGSHAVDLFHYLIGPTRSAAGRAATVAQNIEVDDVGIILLEADGPVFGTVTCSFSNAMGQAVVEIEGTEGTIRVSYWAGVPDLQVCTRSDSAWQAVAGDDEPDRFTAEVAHFLAVVQGREELAVTAEDGLAVQRVVDAAYRSSAAGELRV
jgi:predicted dehydrogenase